MSRWTDLLKSRAAAALEPPGRSPLLAPPPAPVQTSAPPAPTDLGGGSPWPETRAWLQTVQLPPGPLVVRRCSMGRSTRTIVDTALWRQAVLADMELLDADFRWPLSLEAVAGRRRTLLADVAEVQSALIRRPS